MTDKPHYVIIDTLGRAENVKPEWDWFAILDHVYRQVGSAGGNTPLPEMLLRDGKIIVPSKLHHLAWNYGRQRQARIDEALGNARALYPEPTP